MTCTVFLWEHGKAWKRVCYASVYVQTHSHCKELYFNISVSKLCVQSVKRVPKGLNKVLCSSFLISASQKSFSSILHFLPSYFKITCLHQYFLVDFIFSILPVDFLQWKVMIQLYYTTPFKTHTHTFPFSHPLNIVKHNSS